jgi:phage recombination protein Bet
MATTEKEANQSTALTISEKIMEKMVEYEPFQSKEKIQLSVAMVTKFLCKPTKSGKICPPDQAMRFMMLCKTRGLNPWEGDAHLVGFDTSDGPEFSLITAHQAFLKRAEVNDTFEGMDSGVIVQLKDGTLAEQFGDFYDDDQKLRGAWAKIFLKNRPNHPVYKRLRLDAFNKGFGRWKTDPGGMIVKCAEADALRSAFPNTLGGMYLEQEMGNQTEAPQAQLQTGSTVAQLEAQVASSTPATPSRLETELAASVNEKVAEKKAKKTKATTETVAAETVAEPEQTSADIAKEAAAKVTAEPAAETAKAEEAKAEEAKQPAEQESKPEFVPEAGDGKLLRGVRFPSQLIADDEYPAYTAGQLKEADEQAARIGINLAVFVMKRLQVNLGDLNKAAMGKLIELLKGVS